ncbi:MAG: hypothetical protein ABIQ99_11405 [Thermoflexales bacterium]
MSYRHLVRIVIACALAWAAAPRDAGARASLPAPMGVCAIADTRAPQRPSATIWIVQNNADSGAGSLRQAVLSAATGDTIVFSASLTGQIITLSCGEIAVNASIAINGSGAPGVAVDGASATRIFNIGPNAPVTLTALTLQRGFSGGDGGAVTAGAGSPLILTNVSVISSTAAGAGGGGGIYASASVSAAGGRFQNNACSAVSCFGGGLSASTLVMTGTRFITNTSRFGGGGASASVSAAVENGHFSGNTCVVAGCSGGGLRTVTLNMTGTTFTDNAALQTGGGAYVESVSSIKGGLFLRNQSGLRGGGVMAVASLTVAGTEFIANRAAADGGGIYLSAGALSVTNSLFARNHAGSGRGAALVLGASGGGTLRHSTISSPTLASGSAVIALVGTLNITNTIIASHTIGISRTTGTVNENFNLLFANATDRVPGIATGANTVYGDPAFAQPGADNYHLAAASAARDSGVNIGIGIDFDGDARPIGPGFDIGYDETPLRPAFIPVALR